MYRDRYEQVLARTNLRAVVTVEENEPENGDGVVVQAFLAYSAGQELLPEGMEPHPSGLAERCVVLSLEQTQQLHRMLTEFLAGRAER